MIKTSMISLVGTAPGLNLQFHQTVGWLGWVITETDDRLQLKNNYRR